MSAIELSKKTELTQAAISQIENGKREPSLKSIIKLIAALGVKFERLVS